MLQAPYLYFLPKSTSDLADRAGHKEYIVWGGMPSFPSISCSNDFESRPSCVVHWCKFSTNDHWLRGLMDKQWPADILQWPMIELDLSRRHGQEAANIYWQFFPSHYLDLMSVPTKWNKVCCHSERSWQILKYILTHIDGWCHDGCQTSTNMTVFFDYCLLLHTDPYRTLYKSNFEQRLSKNILSRWYTSVVAAFAFLSGILDQIYCLEVQVGQMLLGVMKLSFCPQFDSQHSRNQNNFMLHAATYLGAFFAYDFLVCWFSE